MSSNKRKSYTAAFKLSAVSRAEEVGNRGAAREFSVDERCIRRWRSDKDVLALMPKTKRARRNGTIAWPALEDNLEEWIKEQRGKGLSISTVKIRMQAKLIAGQMGISNFIGGPNWCFRFMKRKKLCVRQKTTVGQKLPADWEEKKESFLSFVKSKVEELGLKNSQVINMDEVPLSFDCPPNRTVEEVGAKSVNIITTGNEKTSFTCVLSCTASGEKLLPLLIFKRKTLPKGNFPNDVVIRANEKGWMCEAIMLQWLEEVYRKRKGAFFQPRGLLVLDSMRSHLLASVKEQCSKKLSTTLAVIPGGLTKKLQPLDLSVNAVFKQEMRRLWEEWMASGMHSFTKSGRMKRASYEEVAGWVSQAWKAVKGRTVIAGFIKAGIIEGAINSEDESESEEMDNSEIDNELLKLFNSESEGSDFEGF